MKTITGTVVSHAMKKTAVISYELTRVHPKYRKSMRMTRRLKIHDPEDKSKVGDRVEAVSVRPLSKEVHYQLSKIISGSNTV